MRRLVGFALGGMVAIWLVAVLPASASTIALALVIGVGVAGGRTARGWPDVVALAIGAFLGAAASGLIQGLGTDGPDAAEVTTGSVTIAITVAVAAALSSIFAAARRPAPPTGR
jgi:hypothetical protein